MPALTFGGDATFGPLISAVIRSVADNVEEAIIPDYGHWITEEQPRATTTWSSTSCARRVETRSLL
jgi:hypothetical protein